MNGEIQIAALGLHFGLLIVALDNKSKISTAINIFGLVYNAGILWLK